MKRERRGGEVRRDEEGERDEILMPFICASVVV